jgi:hypothetical protein
MITEDAFLYTCLTEECAEVGQAVCKVLRFGRTGIRTAKRPHPNDVYLVHELIDILAIVELLKERQLLPELAPDQVACLLKDKKARVLQTLEQAKAGRRIAEIQS